MVPVCAFVHYFFVIYSSWLVLEEQNVDPHFKCLICTDCHCIVPTSILPRRPEDDFLELGCILKMLFVSSAKAFGTCDSFESHILSE